MDPGSIALLTGLMGVVVVLTEIVKNLVYKKKKNGNGHLTPAQAEQLLGVARFCTQFEIRWEYMKNDIQGLKDEQAASHSLVNKLIASQQHLIERMSELVGKMDRVLERK